jgi:hypothetical protein
MSIVVNGYTLNQVGEPANWSAIEYAFLSAVAALMPASGTTLATTEHKHDRLYAVAGGNPQIQCVAGNTYFNPNYDQANLHIRGDVNEICWFDATNEQLNMYDDKKITFGNGIDAQLWSDGATGRFLANLPTCYDGLAAGELWRDTTAGNTVKEYHP